MNKKIAARITRNHTRLANKLVESGNISKLEELANKFQGYEKPLEFGIYKSAILKFTENIKADDKEILAPAIDSTNGLLKRYSKKQAVNTGKKGTVQNTDNTRKIRRPKIVETRYFYEYLPVIDTDSGTVILNYVKRHLAYNLGKRYQLGEIETLCHNYKIQIIESYHYEHEVLYSNNPVTVVKSKANALYFYLYRVYRLQFNLGIYPGFQVKYYNNKPEESIIMYNESIYSRIFDSNDFAAARITKNFDKVYIDLVKRVEKPTRELNKIAVKSDSVENFDLLLERAASGKISGDDMQTLQEITGVRKDALADAADDGELLPLLEMVRDKKEVRENELLSDIADLRDFINFLTTPAEVIISDAHKLMRTEKGKSTYFSPEDILGMISEDIKKAATLLKDKK